MRSTLISIVVGGLSVVSSAAVSIAAVVGPMYPPPGGVSLVGSGNSGQTGGATWTFSSFASTDGLYWGKTSASSVALSLDGGVISGTENMTFSGISGNVATWNGSSTIHVSNGAGYTATPVNTRFVLTGTDLSNAPISFTTPAAVDPTFPVAADAVIDVAGDFKVNRLFEAFWGGSWQPSKTLYDGLPTNPSITNGHTSSFGAGFYVVPEPSSLALLALGGIALLRRRAKLRSVAG